MEIEDGFEHLCFLRVAPSITNELVLLIENILDLYKVSNLIQDFSGPFYTYGQYDIFFIFRSNDLARGSRLFYSMLDYINLNNNNIINDFHAELGFKWNAFKPNSNKHNRKDCLACVSFKFKYPSIKHTSYPVAEAIIEQIYKGKPINNNFLIDIYGSMSWYELVVLVYGDYAGLERVVAFDGMDKLVADIKIIIFSNAILTDDGLENVEAVDCHVKIVSGREDKFKDFLDNNFGDEVGIYKSLTGSHFLMHFHSMLDYKKKLDVLCSSELVQYTKSSFYRPQSQSCEKSALYKRQHTSKLKNLNEQLLLDRFFRLESVSVSMRKLYALRTAIKILTSNEQYRYIIPSSISRAVTYIIQAKNLSDETIQYYISEIEDIINQRLAGAQHDAVIGKDIRYNKGHTSYQRLLLACEFLISKCFSLYLKYKMSVEVPNIYLFTLFDYGARLSSQIPPDIAVKGVEDNMPLILRLKMLKYKPWLWITGLRELSRLVYAIANKKPTFDILLQDPFFIAYEDGFIGEFLSFNNYKKVLLEELKFYEKINNNTMQVNYYKQPEILNRVGSKRKDTIVSKAYDSDLFDKYKGSLLKGEIVLALDDDRHFISYINAYYDLSRALQTSSKPFVSFVLSLYWNHRDIKGYNYEAC